MLEVKTHYSRPEKEHYLHPYQEYFPSNAQYFKNEKTDFQLATGFSIRKCVYLRERLKYIIMKKIQLVVFILLASLSMNAQELKTNDVPKSFTDGLLKAYPTATNINWDKRGMDYKVKFDVGRNQHEIWFNKDSKMVKIEKSITRSEIPSNLMEIINRDYPNYRIDSVESVEKDGDVTFVVELEKSWNESLRITFNTNGQILRALRD